MTATFRAELIFGSNAEEAAAAAVKASDTMSKAQINAQSKIAATIARGDPLKALQVQQFKELQSVYELEKKKTISVRDAEAARKQLTEKFAKERLAIEQQTAAQVVSISKTGISANGGLEKSAKTLKEQMAQVGTAVSQVGGAFGGMGGQAITAGSSIAGAFGSGGLVGVALAGTATAIGIIAAEWKKIQDGIKAQKAANDQLRKDAVNAGTYGEEAALKALADLTTKPGDSSAERAKAFGEFASANAAKGSAAAMRADALAGGLGGAEAALAAARADASAEMDPTSRRAANARASAAQIALEDLKARIRDTRAEADDANAAATEAAKAAAAYARLSIAERAKADAKEGKVTDAKEAKALATGASRLQDDREYAALPELRARANASSDEEKIAAFQARFASDTGKIDAADSARTSADLNLRKTAAAVGATDTAKIMQDFADAAGPAAALGMAKVGVDAANSFLDSFSAALKSGKPEDIFKGILQMLPAALSLFGPPGMVAGGLLSGVGKLLGFRDGGAIPQGRNGLGVSEDATLVGMHRREVIFNEEAAASFPGGFPQAVRVGMGLEALPSGGGVQIHQHVHQSFAPTETRAAYQAHLAPAMAATFEDRQSPLVRSSLARSVAEPRSF
jgi:hypothetical protein